MKKLFYVIILLLIVPVVVNATTVKCTTKTNFIVDEDPYKGLSVTCTDGTDSLTCSKSDGSECVKNENFKLQLFSVWGSNASAANYHNMTDEPVLAGETYSLLFSLTYKFESGDKLVIDGKDESDMMMGCDFGCILSGAERSPKANSNSGTSTTPTTPTKPDPTPTEPVHVNVYWVKFDTNGGKEKIKDVAVEEGKTVAKPENPTREGYKFVEWQLNGKTYDFKTKISKTITLKAKWEEDTTGKKNVSFINLSGLLAPYEGEVLDTDVRVETFKSWSVDIFNVGLKWYRGKSPNKIDELVLTARNPKVEEGYYYQAKFTLTPGNGYTLNNTNVTLNKKQVTTTKNETALEFATEVYGPMVKGVSAEPIMVIDDIIEYIASDEKWENRRVYFRVNEHDVDGDNVVVDGKNCITLSDKEHFKLKDPICKGGRMNLTGVEIDGYYEVGHNSLGDLYLTEAASAPGTYSTTITLTDELGRTYSGKVTIVRGKNPLNPVSISSEDGSVWAEFAGAALSTWYVHAEELINKDMGQRVKEDMRITDLGELVSVKNITVSSENGEKSNGAFKIKIKLDEELKKYKHFTFVYIYDAETYRMGAGPEKVEGIVEGDYLVVTLPHLSNYAIYGSNDTKNETKKTTNDSSNNNIFIYSGIGIAVVIAGAVSFVLLKKKKK